MKKVLIPILALIAVVFVFLFGLGMYSWKRPVVGIVDGQLRPCESPDNCVCSEGPPAAQIAPLEFDEPPEQAWTQLHELVSGLPRTQIVTYNDQYMHVEFTTAFFRYVDDVEFRLDPQAGVIHLRSASRVGRSDLGANRNRLERIRQIFKGQPVSQPHE